MYFILTFSQIAPLMKEHEVPVASNSWEQADLFSLTFKHLILANFGTRSVSTVMKHDILNRSSIMYGTDCSTEQLQSKQ